MAALVALLVVLPVVTGCDEAPGPDPVDRRPPVVQNFAYEVEGFSGRPDSITIADLPPDQRTDTTATVRLLLLATAADADGAVERVAFTIEPASAPRASLEDELPPTENDPRLYGLNVGLTLPAVDELYTLRVFAVDTDSLVSNVALGQIRLIPPAE